MQLGLFIQTFIIDEDTVIASPREDCTDYDWIKLKEIKFDNQLMGRNVIGISQCISKGNKTIMLVLS